jgi:hypothetical protein
MYLLLSRRLVDSLSIDPFDAITVIIAEARHALSTVPELRGDKTYQERRQYEILQEASALLTVYLEREGFALRPPQLIADYSELNEQLRKETILRFLRFTNTLQTNIEQQKRVGRFEQLRQTAEALTGRQVRCEFSDEELACLQGTFHRLRDSMAVASDLDAVYAKRLVQRIERLRSEFRAMTYDLSLFWGFVAEASLVLCSAGKDVRELVAEIEKLIAIVWPVQAKALGRPANTPFAFIGGHNRRTPSSEKPRRHRRTQIHRRAKASADPEPRA